MGATLPSFSSLRAASLSPSMTPLALAPLSRSAGSNPTETPRARQARQNRRTLCSRCHMSDGRWMICSASMLFSILAASVASAIPFLSSSISLATVSGESAAFAVSAATFLLLT